MRSQHEAKIRLNMGTDKLPLSLTVRLRLSGFHETPLNIAAALKINGLTTRDLDWVPTKMSQLMVGTS